MNRPVTKIHDISTDEVIEREMNDEEYAQFISYSENFEKEKAEKLKVISAKETAQAKLSALGLTAEEIAALSK